MLAELLEIGADLATRIAAGATGRDLAAPARAAGLVDLTARAAEAAARGETTLAEAMQAVDPTG